MSDNIWEEPDDADKWKKPEPTGKNDMDYPNSVIVNTHSEIPFSQENWKINKEESMRVDVKHKDTVFSIILAKKPYVEIWSVDCYGQLDKVDRVIELGDYFG